MSYFVYILASKRNGTLYIGVTNALAHEIYEHWQGTGSKLEFICSLTLKILRRPKTQFNARPISRSGHESGSSILLRRTILSGLICTKRLRDAKAGWPGQARP